jgi:hypothetical protein
VNFWNIIFSKFTMIAMSSSKSDNTIQSAIVDIVGVRLNRISNRPLLTSQKVIFCASGVVTVTTLWNIIFSKFTMIAMSSSHGGIKKENGEKSWF